MMIEQQTKSRVRGAQHKQKILVVDDDPAAATLISDLLEREGHEVRSAYTSNEAMRVAMQFQPDVAFLDIGLPAMDGFELASHLRALPELRDCHFITITGDTDPDVGKKSKRVGFEAHLVKPITLETLERVLSEGNNPRRERHAAG